MDAMQPIVAAIANDGEEGAVGGLVNPEDVAGADEP